MAKGVAQAVVDVGPAPAAGLGRSLPGRHLRHRQKGGSAVGKTRRGKGTKCMVVVDGNGIPVGAQLASAQLAECRLAESTLARVKVPRKGRGRPRSHLKRVIADRGYDSNALRMRFQERRTELIVPYRKFVRDRRFEDKRNCAATANDGKSSAPTPGCRTSGASRCVTTASLPYFRASFIALA